MLGRFAMYCIPTASVAVTALVLFGPGSVRGAVGARVRGVPTEGGRMLALRIEAVKSLLGAEEATELGAVQVQALAGGQALSPWVGSTGADGVAEARLAAPLPLQGAVEVVVSERGTPTGKAQVIAAGPLQLRGAERTAAVSGKVPGTSRGEVPLEVTVTRGVLAAPFPEAIRIAGAPRLALELSAAGGEVSPERVSTDDRGVALVKLVPLAHQVELTVTARDPDGKTGRWEGGLPVVPGASWIDPASAGGPLQIVSPAPRERVYVSLWNEAERVDGVVVPLSRDPDGFFRGQAALPPALPGRLLYASIASDPLERGVGTVAWPLRPAEGAFLPRPMELLLDGVPAALGREQARAAKARRAGALLVGAAALAEILLLVLRSRAAQRALEAHFAAASGEAGVEVAGAGAALSMADRAQLRGAAREQPVLWALTFVAMIAFAFAMIAAVATFR